MDCCLWGRTESDTTEATEQQQQQQQRYHLGFPSGSAGNESTCTAGVTGNSGLIPGWEKSPGGGHGNPLQYSCLENPMDRGAWRAIVHRVAKSPI